MHYTSLKSGPHPSAGDPDAGVWPLGSSLALHATRIAGPLSLTLLVARHFGVASGRAVGVADSGWVPKLNVPLDD